MEIVNIGLFVLFSLLLVTEARRPPCPTTYPPETPPPTTAYPPTTSSRCSEAFEQWMDLGCESTCDDVPLKYCANDSSSAACAPGCYCQPTDFWGPIVRNANRMCVSYRECRNPHYQCCPACKENERCDIGIYCPRTPCPYPYAQCVPS